MKTVSQNCKSDQTRAIRSKSGKQATYFEYCSLVKNTFGVPKRDVFTNQPVVHAGGNYVSLFEPNIFGKLRSMCRDACGFSASALEDHLLRLAGELKPEFLLRIPNWDQRDRIRQISSRMNVKNCEASHVEQHIKEWGALMFQRLASPSTQNKCIVLIGAQGIGKDHLVATLVGALEQYLRELTLVKFMDESDLGLLLSSALCVQISEFDRTAQFDTATLKAILTKEYSDFRPKYGRTIVRHIHRCSFIATCNQKHIFRDFTGNRRFVVLELNGGPGQAIDWNYPATEVDRLQILAQFRHLASESYRVSQEAHTSMRGYIDSMTPEDPEMALLEEFDERLRELQRTEMKGDARFSNRELADHKVFDALSRAYGMKVGRIRHLLSCSGRGWRVGHSRGYCTLDSQEEPENDVQL